MVVRVQRQYWGAQPQGESGRRKSPSPLAALAGGEQQPPFALPLDRAQKFPNLSCASPVPTQWGAEWGSQTCSWHSLDLALPPALLPVPARPEQKGHGGSRSMAPTLGT